MVQAVLRVERGLGQVGAVQVWVDEGAVARQVGGPLVFVEVTAVVAQGRRSDGLARGGSVLACVLLLDVQVRVGEGGVRQSEAELVDGCDVLLVEGAVVDEDALFEVVLRRVVAVNGLVD